jgi:hypothetical protein
MKTMYKCYINPSPGPHIQYSGPYLMSSRSLSSAPPNSTARPVIGTASDPVRVFEALYEYCGIAALFSNVFPLHRCERIPHCNLRKCRVLSRCGWTVRDGPDRASWKILQDISGKGRVALSGSAVFPCQGDSNRLHPGNIHVPW